MNIDQNPSFSETPSVDPNQVQNLGNQNPGAIPSTPDIQEVNHPVTPKEGGDEILRVWDIQSEQSEQNPDPTHPETTYADPGSPRAEADIPQPGVIPNTQETPKTEEKAYDPISFIRGETPHNSEPEEKVLPTNPPEFKPVQQESTVNPEMESLEKQLVSVKELVSVLLNNQKIRDFTVFPVELGNPEVFISENSGREMIKPFGIEAIRFGFAEFKVALDNALFLEENTYILKYLSERPREDGSTPEPKYLKCTSEQIKKWKDYVQETEQGDHTQLQEQF
jgi:hypothetical protein